MSSIIGPADTDVEGNRETHGMAAVFTDFMWQRRRKQEEITGSGCEGGFSFAEVEDDIP